MLENDLQAIIDLTMEKFSTWFPVRPIVLIKNVRRGTAKYANKKISIPQWAFQYGDSYITYYVLHELTHFYNGRLSHGFLFKSIENKVLELWGLSIERAKVYPRALYANGQPQPHPYQNK